MRAAVVVALFAAAAVVVSAARVKVTPPGFYELDTAKIAYPSCNGAADNAFKILTGNANAAPSYFIDKQVPEKDIPKYVWSDPGKTLCDGKDRIIYLSMGVAPKDKWQYSHHALLQTFGGGKYAMLYQSYSESAHKDDQGKSYTMQDWIAAAKPHIEGKDDPAIGNLPPIIKSLPCDCADMAGWLQALLDSNTAAVIKREYNRMFTPQNDKVGVKAGLTTFWGSVWQEKDFFHLYKFVEAAPSKYLKTSAFLETAVHHGVQHRLKSPAALVHLKQARKQHVQRMRKAKIVAHL